jgi:sRNA-binding carbon storage regulator CsrA|tara:strand:+ start:1416 stop:1619 length:204 start_codon:yes stop_codon:yes gene_type:complete
VSKLVLTRKESVGNGKDAVLIHKDGEILVKINIAKVSGKTVKIAFESIDEIISVDREELYDKKYLSE